MPGPECVNTQVKPFNSLRNRRRIFRISRSVAAIVILISAYIVNASVLEPVIENVVHLQATKPPNGVSGIWKKKTVWKPRWVKEWKSAKVMKPVWRKIWGPVQIREWVPIPKPPPVWDSQVSTKLVKVKTAPKTKTLLWDPVPYPESQQPPPPAVPHFIHADTFGSETFNDQQIAGIIGANKYKNTPDYLQSAEYSESVTHLTRVPPNDNWRQLPQPATLQQDNRFNFQDLPPYLVPPRFQFQTDNTHLQFRNPNEQEKLQQSFKFPPEPNVNFQLSPGFEIKPTNNDQRQWNPLPPSNNIKGHFITTSPNQPYKFQTPESSVASQVKNVTTKQNAQKEVVTDGGSKPGFKTQGTSNNVHSQVGTDFIQEAQLVGEYHYSEFDAKRQVEPEKPEVNTDFKEIENKNKVEVKPSTSSSENRKPVLPQVRQPNPTKGPVDTGPKTNPRPVEETKPRQVRTQSKPQEIPLVHNKPHTHVNLPRPQSNFEQERAIPLEIFPIYRTTSSPLPIPKNHRFSPKENAKLEPIFLPNPNSNFSSNVITYPNKELPLQKFENDFRLQPFPPKPLQEPIIAPVEANETNYTIPNTTQNIQKTSLETTTPFLVFSTSSFTTTTEPQTNSPVYVVTPVYPGKT